MHLLGLSLPFSGRLDFPEPTNLLNRTPLFHLIRLVSTFRIILRSAEILPPNFYFASQSFSFFDDSRSVLECQRTKEDQNPAFANEFIEDRRSLISATALWDLCAEIYYADTLTCRSDRHLEKLTRTLADSGANRCL